MVDYEAWERSVPNAVSGDVLWKVQAYRLALFAGDIGWEDVTKLSRDRRTGGVADQLYRALGSIGANIAEGYSRGSGRDRARLLEYALGSARESRHWYYSAWHVLTDDVTVARSDCLSRIIRLLLVTIPSQRARTLRELPASYWASGGQSITHHERSASRITDQDHV